MARIELVIYIDVDAPDRYAQSDLQRDLEEMIQRLDMNRCEGTVQINGWESVEDEDIRVLPSSYYDVDEEEPSLSPSQRNPSLATRKFS